MAESDIPNRPFEWDEWDTLFDKGLKQVEDKIGPASLDLDQGCFDLVAIALPLLRRWDTITDAHVSYRLRKEIERYPHDRARAILRGLMANLSMVKKRHFNDYTTDMAGTVYYLQHLIDVVKEWTPETNPLEPWEIIAYMKEIGDDDPGECLGMLRDRWERAKPKKPKEVDKGGSTVAPPKPPNAAAEERQIHKLLTNKAKAATPLETLDAEPTTRIAFALPGHQFYPFSEKDVSFILGMLAKR